MTRRRAQTLRHASARQARRAQAGFTVMEMMVASMIMMAVTGAVFQLMNPAQGTFQAQPEVSDMQQRMRVGVDVLAHDLVMAGAGSYAGAAPGALYNFFAPIMPYRRGDLNNDPTSNVFYRSDTISLLYVPPTPAQTTIEKAMPQNSAEIDVEPQANCGPNKKDSLCGFKPGQRVIIFDTNGNWDTITITNVQGSPSKLQHNKDKLSASYSIGSSLSEISSHTYYLKTDNTAKTYQLMHYDGAQTETPVVDNVVKLAFEYFGESQPPQLIPNKALSDAKGPWTTYGPKPPALGATDSDNTDEYPSGTNCAFDVVDGKHVPRLPVLAAGVGEVKLTEGQMKDGPWCPNASSPVRFDADLLRIRHVRVNLRVQAAQAALRGPAGTLFTKAGTSTSTQRFVPDQEIRFDIAPRNMNLGR
jgi:hypothetical protein